MHAAGFYLGHGSFAVEVSQESFRSQSEEPAPFAWGTVHDERRRSFFREHHNDGTSQAPTPTHASGAPEEKVTR
jgi:hypothetical protein